MKKIQEITRKKSITGVLILVVSLVVQSVNGQAGYNVSSSSGPVNIAVPDNSLTGARISLSLTGAGTEVIDATSVISATVSVLSGFNADVDMYLIGPNNCGTLELSTDNGSSGSNYQGAVLVTPASVANINTLTNPVNNISGIWKAEGTYDFSPAQTILFDFNNAPLYTSLPINLTENGVTAQFSATGQGFSIQNANVLGFTPAGFSGRCIYPNSIYGADLLISFDHTITNFSILYSAQELGCDDAATMRVTAKMNGTIVGTNTKTATHPGTWPVDTLKCSFLQGFNNVVVHYDSHPPTCQDYGVIFMADDMWITSINTPSILASGTGGGTYALPMTSISGCAVNGNWTLFVADDAAGNTATVKSFDLNITNIASPALNLKAFIEGYYMGFGQMNPLLYMMGISPDPLATDTVVIELHESTAPYSIIFSSSVILQSDGNTQVSLPTGVVNNSYYITIKHRNSIETWSSSPVIFNNGTTNYDFTISPAQAYGNNMSDLGDGNFAMWSGDISDASTGIIGIQDGVIEAQDYSDMENAVSIILTGYVHEDLTGDGVVESFDYLIEENNVSSIIFAMHP